MKQDECSQNVRVDCDPYSDKGPVQPWIAFVEDTEISKTVVVYHSKKNALQPDAKGCSFLD